MPEITLADIWKNPDFIHSIEKSKVNLSYSEVRLKILNVGTTSLEQCKLKFGLQGDIESVSSSNFVSGMDLIKFNTSPKSSDITINSKTGHLLPNIGTLVGSDSLISDPFYIKTKPEATKVEIHWELLAKNFVSKGKLTVNINPCILPETKNILTDDFLLVKKSPVAEGIKEYIVERDLAEQIIAMIPNMR